MVKWKFWQRSADTTTDAELPPEVQEYYESTRRGRKGIAIILAIITVIVTLLLAAVLYFAGRYVWQKFFDNDQPTTTQQEVAPTEQPTSTAPDEGSDTSAGDDGDSTNDESDADSTTVNGDEDSTGTSSTATDDADDSSSSNDTDNSENGKETTPSEVPDTGPGEVFAVALLAAIAAGLAYEIVPRVKSARK